MTDSGDGGVQLEIEVMLVAVLIKDGRTEQDKGKVRVERLLDKDAIDLDTLIELDGLLLIEELKADRVIGMDRFQLRSMQMLQSQEGKVSRSFSSSSDRHSCDFTRSESRSWVSL